GTKYCDAVFLRKDCLSFCGAKLYSCLCRNSYLDDNVCVSLFSVCTFCCIYIELVTCNSNCLAVCLKQFDHLIDESCTTLLNVLSGCILVNFTDDNLSLSVSNNIFDCCIHILCSNSACLCVVCSNVAHNRSFRSIVNTSIECNYPDSFLKAI